MTPQELKASILQLAVQGKLVEQCPEEGTGEELYQQIRAEKQRLIKVGTIKKEKPLPEIAEDEIPFDLPTTWKWVRLGQCGTFVRGSGIKKDEVTSTGLPCVRYGQLYTRYKTKFTSAVSFIPEELFQKCQKIYPSDILMALTGENNFDIALAVTYSGTETVAMGGDMTKFTGYDIDPLYFTYAINSPYGVMCKSKLATGNIIVHISNDKLASIPIPLPPLAEQKRIVAKIEELLPYIDRYEQAWSKLADFNKRFPVDMQKSILQMAIQGKLVEQRPVEGTGEELYQQIQAEKQRLIKAGTIKKEKPLPEIAEDEIPFDIPESWKWVRWGDLSQSIQYGYNAPAQEKGRIKMVRISDIQDGKVLWDTVPYCDIKETEIPTYLLGANDILFARTGGTVGKSYLVKNVPEDAIYAGYLIRTQYSDQLCPEYMKCFMESQLYWDQLRNGTSKVAQPNCNGKTLAKMILPLPPLAEQKRIVAKLEEILPLCDRLK